MNAEGARDAREASERPPNQRKPETGFEKVLLLDSVPHILVEKCLEMFQCVYYSVHRFPLTVNTGREKCPVRLLVFSAEPGRAKWPDVRTACLKDKLELNKHHSLSSFPFC